jgi:hypothetical protein
MKRPQYLGPLFLLYVIVVQEMHWAYIMMLRRFPRFVLVWRSSKFNGAMEGKELL